jgi:hypothetical protein
LVVEFRIVFQKVGLMLMIVENTGRGECLTVPCSTTDVLPLRGIRASGAHHTLIHPPASPVTTRSRLPA